MYLKILIYRKEKKVNKKYHNVVVGEGGKKFIVTCQHVDFLRKDYQLRCAMAKLTSLGVTAIKI